MLPEKRRQEIVRLNYEKQGISISELADYFKISNMTILRDIKVLVKMGLVEQVRGGVIPVEVMDTAVNNLSDIYNTKRKKSLSEKQQIANYCAENLIPNNSVITLESGSTACFIVKMLKRKEKITLMTNGMFVLKDAAEHLGSGCRIIGSGGFLEKPYSTFVGPEVDHFYRDKNIDVAFISCVGFDVDKGPMDSYPLDVQAKNAMIKVSKRIVLLVDKHKFNIRSIMPTCSMESITDIVTNFSIDESIKNGLLKYSHIKLHLA